MEEEEKLLKLFQGVNKSQQDTFMQWCEQTLHTLNTANNLDGKRKKIIKFPQHQLFLEASFTNILYMSPCQFLRLRPSWRKSTLHMRCMTMSGPTWGTLLRPRTLPSSSWNAVPNRTLTNKNRHRWINSKPSSSSRWVDLNCEVIQRFSKWQQICFIPIFLVAEPQKYLVTS